MGFVLKRDARHFSIITFLQSICLKSFAKDSILTKSVRTSYKEWLQTNNVLMVLALIHRNRRSFQFRARLPNYRLQPSSECIYLDIQKIKFSHSRKTHIMCVFQIFLKICKNAHLPPRLGKSALQAKWTGGTPP